MLLAFQNKLALDTASKRNPPLADCYSAAVRTTYLPGIRNSSPLQVMMAVLLGLKQLRWWIYFVCCLIKDRIFKPLLFHIRFAL